MAGIIGIYGLVVSVLVANDLTQKLPLYTGFIQLGAGLAVGLAGLAAGYVYLTPLLKVWSMVVSCLTLSCAAVLLLVLSVMLVFAALLSNLVSTLE